MMFNNCKLPLNKMQKLQQQATRKQKKTTHDNEQDNALIIAYRNGNEDAGFELFRSYLDIVSYIFRNPHKAQFKQGSKVNIDWTPQDKEDLFQEIGYHFFVLLDEYDEELGDFQGLIKGKLHLRVYDNFFEDVADRHINEIVIDEEIDLEQKARDILLNGNPDKKVPADHMELYMALNQISRKQRQALELSIVKGWNASEVAQELGVSPTSVRMLKMRGLESLRQIMTKEVA